jgi:hypothetical protein
MEEVPGVLVQRRIWVNRMGVKRLTQGKKRAAAHRRAMGIFASLPQLEDPDYVRNAMWGLVRASCLMTQRSLDHRALADSAVWLIAAPMTLPTA